MLCYVTQIVYRHPIVNLMSISSYAFSETSLGKSGPIGAALVQFIGVPPDQPSRRRKTAGLIEKGTLKKRITNIEQGITNIEVRYSIIIIF
jgi:hypothetical protein